MLLQFILAFIVFDYVNGDNTKSSLTFVIDETWSMSDDIDQVKEQTNQVFDAVLSSNASRIDDFIIVTFDDPDARLYTVTRDPREFKKALADITVHGNYDCPEYAMKGIEIALEHSKPNSFFYVFTDAAAKDYEEYDRIKSLALKKSIQITFLLTGMCPNSLWEANAVYDKLAAATNGQVFHLEKQDIQKIMSYIIASVDHIKTTIGHKVFDNESNNTFQFSIDSKVWDVIISVSGVNPKYHITDPDGNKLEENTFITTEKSHISKLGAKPGVYTMHLDSTDATSVSITGSTSVTFQHGFSTVKPTTLNETSTKPILGLPTYLSITLENINKDVSLDTVEIRDINDNIISEFPLTLIDTNQQFYVTKPFSTPNSTFKVAINGHTKSKEKITRLGSTTIEPQKPELEGPEPKKPTVTILEGDEITGEYDKQMTLKCKVNAYPKPNVIWQDNLKTLYSSTIVPVDLPYEYLSMINIEKVNNNVTIECKAVNSLGEDNKYIAVKTKKNFLEVLEFPKDKTFEYGAPAELNFKVNAFPGVKIMWFKNGKQIENNSDYEVSSDGSRLVIRQMREELKGTYTVEAYNDVEIKKHDFKLDISGVVPVIDKSISEYEARKGFNVNIPCRILKSKPPPVISWTFKREGLNIGIPYRETTETLHLNNVSLDHNGIYSCVAQNEFGRDSHEVDLHVVYLPTIKNVETQIRLSKGELVTLNCIVDGSPFPIVHWFFNKVAIENTGKYNYNDNSLSFIGSVEDNGIYTCKASNSLGDAKKDFYVNIYTPIEVADPKNNTLEFTVGDSMNLACQVEGSSKSKVQWTFYSENPSIPPKFLRADSTGSLSLEHVQVKDEGIYRCDARIFWGLKSITYQIHVKEPASILANITTYDAVVGDLALRIPCKATGNPKPVITWKTEDNIIASGTAMFDIEEDGSLIIKNPTLDANNTYTCQATNNFSAAFREFDVYVTAYPQLDYVTETLNLEIGSSPYVQCGLPHGEGNVVRWFKDGRLIASGELHIRNITIEDSGVYSCRVSTLMSTHTVHKKVIVGDKPYFKNKEVTNINYIKGKVAYLNCSAYGAPEPQIIWRHNGNIMETSDMGMAYIFEMKPDNIGSYECVVSNTLGKINRIFNIKYAKEPASILANITTYDAVVGDLALRIPCKATGNPKPVITWKTEDNIIASGTAMFDIEEDGSLIIKNPTPDANNTYTCQATNNISTAFREFDVYVTAYPQLDYVTETLKLEIGSSPYVECGLPHGEGNVVRWFKDGRLIASGELHIRNITIEDSGVYSCRVSTLMSTHTIHKEVIVGGKPYFKNEENIDINFIEGTFAYLDCSAYGAPEPQIIWRHNGNIMKASDMGMTYIFEMKPDNIGSYECVVSNTLGKINRIFNIKYAKECLLDIEKDFNKHQPLLLSRSQQWPDFKIINNFLRLPKSTYFLLSCPGNLVTYNEEEFGEYVETRCVDSSIFKIRDRNVDFAKIKCKEEIKSVAKSTHQRCFSGNTELLKVGINLEGDFLEVYDVCIDKDNKIPLYTRHNLHQGYTGSLPKQDLTFTESKYLPFVFEDMYKCSLQLKPIYFLKGRKLSSPNECCFKKRQMVSPADVIPGLSQIATYNYLNVIPQWSSCGTENWDEIERRIRSLVNFDDTNLSVFTGSSYPIRLPGQTSLLFLSDRFKNLQRVPMYIWKVVQNTHDKSSLAIIQLNVPNITLSEALSSMPCEDICGEVEWMKNDQWHNVEKGFTFCCSITEFSKYYGTLINEHNKVFKTLPLGNRSLK